LFFSPLFPSHAVWLFLWHPCKKYAMTCLLSSHFALIGYVSQLSKYLRKISL
jgi:hypothetical protein